MNKINITKIIGIILLTSASTFVSADERRFTYVYEPETLPEGALEFENWVTLRSQRTKNVGKDNFNRWDLRQELEYGVTDRYTLALYLNERSDSYRIPSSGTDYSKFSWKGVSIENRYNVLNPATYPVGLTLYLEGRYSGEEAEIEEKIILGQRHGLWKWALNLEHETEWEHNLHDIEAKGSVSFGFSRDLGKRWSLGIELLSETIFPEYEKATSSALFLGPAISYHQEKWWATLTVLPQIYGWNNDGNPDGNRHLDLVEHERINVRLIIGINF
jgi:hypothetical protein